MGAQTVQQPLAGVGQKRAENQPSTGTSMPLFRARQWRPVRCPPPPLSAVLSTLPTSFRDAGMAKANSTTRRSKSGRRQDSKGAELIDAWRMWYAPFQATLSAISLPTKLDQRASAQCPATSLCRSARPQAAKASGCRDRAAHQSTSGAREVALGAAMASLPTLAALAVAQKLSEQHRYVLGTAEAGITTFAVEDDANVRGRLAKAQRVGHGQWIAIGIAEPRDGLIDMCGTTRASSR